MTVFINVKIDNLNEFSKLNSLIVNNVVKIKSDKINIRTDKKYALAFEDLKSIRVAVDQKLIQNLNVSIKNVKEVAFFPPMTGG